MEIHVDMVRDFDERNALVHPVVLAVEHHCTFDFPRTGPFAGNRQSQLFGVRYPTDGEVAVDLVGFVSGLDNLRGFKGDKRIIFNVEEVIAF